MTLRSRYIRDAVMRGLLAFSAVIIVVPLVVILGYVVVNGIGALNWSFFTEELGSPARAMQGRPTGLAHSIVGTVVIDLMALAFALVVRPFGRFSAVAGSVALAFVMFPIIARSVESVLRTTPWSLREVGLALGLPRWRVVVSTVLPAAKTGILTGVLIAFARAAGEAAPLLFTSFGQNYMNLDVGRAMDTLPQRLYSLAISPYREWHAMGWAAAIVLLAFVMTCFFAARFLASKFSPGAES